MKSLSLNSLECTHMSHMQICAFKNKLHSPLAKLANKKIKKYETKLIIEREWGRERGTKFLTVTIISSSFLGYFTVKFNHNVQFKNEDFCRLSHLRAIFLETHEEEPHLLLHPLHCLQNNALQSRERFINAIRKNFTLIIFVSTSAYLPPFSLCLYLRLSSPLSLASMPLNWNVHERLQ